MGGGGGPQISSLRPPKRLLPLPPRPIQLLLVILVVAACLCSVWTGGEGGWLRGERATELNRFHHGVWPCACKSLEPLTGSDTRFLRWIFSSAIRASLLSSVHGPTDNGDRQAKRAWRNPLSHWENPSSCGGTSIERPWQVCSDLRAFDSFLCCCLRDCPFILFTHLRCTQPTKTPFPLFRQPIHPHNPLRRRPTAAEAGAMVAPPFTSPAGAAGAAAPGARAASPAGVFPSRRGGAPPGGGRARWRLLPPARP